MYKNRWPNKYCSLLTPALKDAFKEAEFLLKEKVERQEGIPTMKLNV